LVCYYLDKGIVDPEEAVAIGAVRVAQAMEDREKKNTLIFLQVTPLSLGIETHGGQFAVFSQEAPDRIHCYRRTNQHRNQGLPRRA